jgi:hypothetical protein
MSYDQEFETEFEASEFGEELESDFEMDFGEGEFEFEGGDFEMEADDFELESPPAARRGAGAASDGNIKQAIARQRAAMTQLRQAIPRMARHIRKEGNRFRLVLPAKSLPEAAARLKVPAGTVRGMLQALKQANLRLGRGGRRGEIDMEEEVSGACPGETKVTTHWWGTKVFLNECHTKALVEALGGGMSAAAACAVAVPVPHVKAACAIAAPLLGVGAAAIKAIDALGGNRGIIIRRLWASIPPAPSVIIWHQ